MVTNTVFTVGDFVFSEKVCEDLKSIKIVSMVEAAVSVCTYEECVGECQAAQDCQGWTWVSQTESAQYGACTLSHLTHDPAGTVTAIAGLKLCQGEFGRRLQIRRPLMFKLKDVDE